MKFVSRDGGSGETTKATQLRGTQQGAEHFHPNTQSNHDTTAARRISMPLSNAHGCEREASAFECRSEGRGRLVDAAWCTGCLRRLRLPSPLRRSTVPSRVVWPSSDRTPAAQSSPAAFAEADSGDRRWLLKLATGRRMPVRMADGRLAKPPQSEPSTEARGASELSICSLSRPACRVYPATPRLPRPACNGEIREA